MRTVLPIGKILEWFQIEVSLFPREVGCPLIKKDEEAKQR